MTDNSDTVTLPSTPPNTPQPPNPYGQQYGAPLGPPPAPPGQPAQQQPVKQPGRGRFVAGVLAAALVVGGGAGLGGAAAYDALNGDDPASDSGAASTLKTASTAAAPADPAVEGSVEAVAEKVLPSVVQINVSGGQGSGSGSGIVLTEDGQILTNEHVVEVAQGGGTLSVSFDDGTTAAAEVLGTDPLTDTAVIQAQGVSGLTPATIGSSDELRIGQTVVAIGSPFGLESTVTSGIVSALNRPVQVASDGAGNSTTYPAIQTDAAINPGNSGGPLVDLSGNVVGINSSIRTSSTGSDGSIGLGFSIPIDEVLPIVQQMAAGEQPTHAKLGVTVRDVQSEVGTATSTSQGAQIAEVAAGSTADQAGLKSGDIVTAVDDTRITGADSLVATIRSYRPGDTVTLTWLRNGTEQSASLTLDTD
ncbi:S1C family serine protease [Nocardioides sp.]|uniref:S1C family serine protease n=1 Tax=Nocardioides sp. TaxID=35761 RepID=UPI00356AD0C0